jgi:hypothetical protein
MASLAKDVMRVYFPSNGGIIFAKDQQQLFLYHTLIVHN